MQRSLWLVVGLLVSCGPATAQPMPAVKPLNTRQAGVDWPRFLGPSGTSVSPEKGLIAPWPKLGLRIVWQCSAGEGYCAPTISKGRLFHFERVGNTARLECLHSETGKELWKFEYSTEYRDKYGYDNGPRCCPVIDDDRVYLYGAEGMLHCLRVADGKVVWKVDTQAEFGVIQNFFGVGSTPVIEGDLLIAQVGGSPAGSDKVPFGDLKGNGSGIVAFDKRTGKVVYKITDELASYSSPVLATINGRRWCLVLARGGLVGFEPASGKVDFHYAWRAPDFESVNASNPVVVGDRVFISECYSIGSTLLKVKPGSCEVVWTDANKKLKNKSMMCHWMTPIYHDGYLYGSSGRHAKEGELRCIELATGKVMWSEARLTRTSLLLIDGHFICQTEVGPLLLLKPNPQRFEQVSMTELIEPCREDVLGACAGSAAQGAIEQAVLYYPCWAAPVVSRGLMYLRGPDRLVCVEVIAEKKG
jgi:outer membrane protein assembly factor BamB